MYQEISHTTPVARKDYICDACVGIFESDPSYYIDEMTFAEKRLLVKAIRDGKRIKKGNKYSKSVYKFDGELQTFRGRPEITDICQRIGVWDDAW